MGKPDAKQGGSKVVDLLCELGEEIGKASPNVPNADAIKAAAFRGIADIARVFAPEDAPSGGRTGETRGYC
jgi:hypothetical protein